MIHLPTRVVTNLDGQEIHVTDGAFPTGTKDVFELRTAGGYRVKLTADHKVWTRARGWVEAKDLQPSDEVQAARASRRCVHEIGEPQDPQFFQLLGLFLSDANGDVDALRLDACLPDAALMDALRPVRRRELGRPRVVRRDDYVNRAMVDGPAAIGDRPRPAGNTLTATLTNRRLLSRLKRSSAPTPARRRLGDEAFTAGLAAQKHLLRALFTADGDVADGTLELAIAQPAACSKTCSSSCSASASSPRSSSATQGAATHETTERREASSSHSGGLARTTGRHSTCLACAPTAEAALDGGPTAGPARAATQNSRRHGLRIDPGSLRSFGKHVGLLPGRKLEQLADAISLRHRPPRGRRQLRPRRRAHAAGQAAGLRPDRAGHQLVRRQRADRAQLLGIHVPGRHGVQPG